MSNNDDKGNVMLKVIAEDFIKTEALLGKL